MDHDAAPSRKRKADEQDTDDHHVHFVDEDGEKKTRTKGPGHQKPLLGRKNKRLYVTNIDFKVQDDEFYEAFEPYGEVIEAKIARDDSGKSRGFGFVAFPSQEAAEAALFALNGKALKKRNLCIVFARAKNAKHDGTKTAPKPKKKQDSKGRSNNNTNNMTSQRPDVLTVKAIQFQAQDAIETLKFTLHAIEYKNNVPRKHLRKSSRQIIHMYKHAVKVAHGAPDDETRHSLAKAIVSHFSFYVDALNKTWECLVATNAMQELQDFIKDLKRGADRLYAICHEIAAAVPTVFSAAQRAQVEAKYRDYECALVVASLSVLKASHAGEPGTAVQQLEKHIAPHQQRMLPAIANIDGPAATAAMAARLEAVKDFLRVVRQIPLLASCGPSVALYGSMVMGLATESSDVDVGIKFDSMPSLSKIKNDGKSWKTDLTDRGYAMSILRLVANHFRETTGYEVKTAFRARVPVFRVSVKGIDVEASMYHEENLHKSRLVAEYVKQDPRVAPVILGVKLWAHARGIADSTTNNPNTFAWTLMVLHFLQQQGVIGVFNTFPTQTPWVTQNKAAVGELLLGFFEYMANFRAGDLAISVGKGRTLQRIHDDSDAMDTEDNREDAVHDGEVSGPNHALIVIDPLEPGENVARNVTQSHWKRIHRELLRAFIVTTKHPAYTDAALFSPPATDFTKALLA